MMENLDLTNLDNEVLVELLGSLEGLDDALNAIEGDMKNEKSND